MQLIINSLWIFSFFSFVGWFISFAYDSVKRRRLVNPGFITLPFLPSYGIGILLLFALFSYIKDDVILFVASGVFLTLYKFALSRFFERSFGFKWKNTKREKIRIGGFSIEWEPFLLGAIGLILIKFVSKPITSFISGLPFWAALLIPAVITGLIIADTVISVITVLGLRRNLMQMKNISELIDDKNSDIPDDELRKSYERRMLKSKRFRLRLVKAFPDMESLDYEKQLADLRNNYDLLRKKNNEVYENTIEDVNERPFAYGLCFSKLFWLFLIGSFFGTILETGWALVMEHCFEMRVGMVLGPFIPVYGGGAVAITLCLYKLHRKKDLIVYLASALIGATFEYLCSYFQEMFLGTISWDYSDTPFNLDGRTNLTFALIWGVLGLAWLRYLYPVISRLIEKIPKKIGRIVTVILVVFMAVNAALSVLAVMRDNERKDNIPPKTVIGQFVDKAFPDEYMDFVFPHMGTKETFAEGRKSVDK